MKQLLALIILLFISLLAFAQTNDTVVVDSGGTYRLLKAGRDFFLEKHTEDGNKEHYKLDTLVLQSIREGNEWTFASLYFTDMETTMRLCVPGKDHLIILGNTIQYGYISFMIWSDDGGMTWQHAGIKSGPTNDKSLEQVMGYGEKLLIDNLKIFDGKNGILLNYKSDVVYRAGTRFIYLLTEDGGRTWTRHWIQLPIGYGVTYPSPASIKMSDDGHIEIPLILTKKDERRNYKLVSHDYGWHFKLVDLE